MAIKPPSDSNGKPLVAQEDETQIRDTEQTMVRNEEATTLRTTETLTSNSKTIKETVLNDEQTLIRIKADESTKKEEAKKDKVISPDDNDAAVIRTLDNHTPAADATLVRPPTTNNQNNNQANNDATRVRQSDETNLRPNIAAKIESKQSTNKTNKEPSELTQTSTRPRVERRQNSARTPNDNTTQTLNPLTNTFHTPFSRGGEVINNRFIIEKVLGRGGMGMVCKALDLRKVEADDQQPYVAIKLLTGAFQEHASAFKSLQREAKKSQALAHPNIITVFDFDRDDETIFMTMEVLDGYPLDAIIKGKTDVILDKKTALSIVREIAQALEYAHSKGIIHSDLKPANIFYTKTGQTKVLDFGIARALGNDLYKDNFDAGDLNAITPKYASLEMFEREAPDPRDDIYALGLIAGELLGGKHPYHGQFATVVSSKKLKPEVGKNVGFLYKKVIVNAAAIQKDQRTQTARKFLSLLNWAEKGPKRVAIFSVLILAMVIGNSFLIKAVDDDIPLSSLPIATQAAVTKNIGEADTALTFNDYNGALIYLEKAYELHPSNNDVENRANKIISTIEKSLTTEENPEAKAYIQEQLKEIGSYKFIATNERYTKLIKN